VKRILLIRLGAMGDVLHALPAAAALRDSGAHVTWLIDPKWRPLIAGSPDVDQVIELNRRSWSSVRAALVQLRAAALDAVIDLQGLLKSAFAAELSAAPLRYGFAPRELRERAAGLFYTHHIATQGPHVVERNLELVRGALGRSTPVRWRVPQGHPEGELPAGPFVLANPLAGWPAKQWPMDNYGPLAARLRAELGLELVLNHGGPIELPPGTRLHTCGLDGLIDATRRAAAVLGLDSGPLHLAAALGRPGVALFGPTDPARNGPYGGSIAVLRHPASPTSYRRSRDIDPGLASITVDEVFLALKERLRV
jgi:heptosyltransferase I